MIIAVINYFTHAVNMIFINVLIVLLIDLMLEGLPALLIFNNIGIIHDVCGLLLWYPAVVSCCGLELWSPAVVSRCGLLLWSPAVVSCCGLPL